MLPAFIDDAGDLWPERSQVLSERLRTNRVGQELLPLVIDNLGFIHLSMRGRFALVVFNMGSVTVQALCGLMYWAGDNPYFSFLVKDRESGQTKLIPNQGQLLRNFAERLATQAPDEGYCERIVAVETSAFSTRWSAAREIVRTIGTTSKTEIILDALFAGHWTVSEFSVQRNRYQFVGLGKWYYNFDANAHKLLGKSPVSFGDPNFGERVDKAISSMDETSGPRVHHVTASIAWQDRPAKMFDFTRLLVPISRGGRRLLISAAAVH